MDSVDEGTPIPNLVLKISPETSGQNVTFCNFIFLSDQRREQTLWTDYERGSRIVCTVPTTYRYGMVYQSLTSHSTQYRSFRRRLRPINSNQQILKIQYDGRHHFENFIFSHGNKTANINVKAVCTSANGYRTIKNSKKMNYLAA